MISLNNHPEKRAYTEFIRRNGPFAYFITLTFPRWQTVDACTQQINYLMHFLNKKIYGRNSGSEYLEGFCFFEKHKTSANNPLHSHILIKHDSRLDTESKISFIDHFWNMINKVRVVKTNRVTDKEAFNKKCCDIQRIYDEDKLIDYVTKSFESKYFDFNNFRPIGQHGI
ncbi:hypothetical protein Geob_0595 [Geotalea daltonii FRC-32]|uniref:Replication protein n=1 Tax=Geotalea daltonii (strain DSM 22248 / JCM 15807 / FRC-32) TaxID=316067 RepID=B9M0C4_GEODF|nr:hypothetical protein [Geotalea daltonii]ACM18961.1 hypothetical protein Geob_0595 [Geotalea daltonii FRC-32]